MRWLHNIPAPDFSLVVNIIFFMGEGEGKEVTICQGTHIFPL